MLSRLYTLLLVLVVAWSSWAAFGPGGSILCVIVFVFAIALAIRSWAGFLFFVLCLLLLGMLLLPAVQCRREAARRIQCLNNMKQIAMALHNYHDTYKSFPPAYIADKNGKPMHSWRVLILPYMDEDSLYRQYNFNEQWDGPNNRKLLALRPPSYVCPSDEQFCTPGATTTNYVAVVGANAAWQGEKSRSYHSGDFEAGLSRTILLIEVADAGINWTEPRDLDVDALQTAANASLQVKPSSKHMRSNGFYRDTVSGVNAAIADGSVRFIPAGNLTADRLKYLLARGGYKDDEVDSTLDNQELQIDWPRVAALAVWIVSTGLLLYRAVRSRKKAVAIPAELAG